ncbi:MAG: Gldg family protein [Deltaproteobacteria bacterium]|nr:Gldg family protein [Deltaproteobacteria bacterium]
MKKKWQFYLHTFFIIILTLGVVVFVNFISHRHYKKIDFTQNKSHTLSDQSIQVARNIQKEVKLIGFFKKQEKQIFLDLVDKYTYYTDKIKKQSSDPDVDVGLAELHGIRKSGVIVVEGPKKTIKVEEITEEVLTNALIKAVAEKEKKFYFVTGHLEKSIQNKEGQGYTYLKKELEDTGYAVNEVLLLKDGKVPEDCDVLVIAGEEKPYLREEVEAIKMYVEKGGSLYLALDPQKKTSFEKLLNEWGVTLHDDIIIDKESRLLGGDFLIPLVFSYGEHEISRDFKDKKVVTFFPLTRSFEVLPKLPEGVSFKFLAQTSANAWGETEPKNKKVEFNAGKDYPGPLSLAAAIEKEKQGKIVLFGTSHMATNTFLYKLSNRDFILNSLSWLAQDTNLVSIRPKKSNASTMTLTPSQGKKIAAVTVFLIPLSIILFGVFYWNRRRKK